jgi:hypothetical protein
MIVAYDELHFKSEMTSPNLNLKGSSSKSKTPYISLVLIKSLP